MLPIKPLSLLLCLCLLLSALPAFAGQVDVDQQVDKYLKGAKTVGGSVVVMRAGRLVYARDYGYKNLRAKAPVDENTYFKSASITKMVTGIGLMRLVDEGKLDLDADISDYFGYRIGNPYYPNIPLTLRQLMSHTASISESGGFSNLRNGIKDMLPLSLNRRGNFYKTEPGSSYKYSNFGAGIAGAIMEAVTQQSVNAYMTEAIFAPLDLGAAYAAAMVPNPDDVSSQYLNGALHRAAAGQIKQGYEDHADPDMHYRTTAGDLWIRSRDLAKLAAVLAGDGSLEGGQVLSEESVQMMRLEQNSLNLSVTGESPYGLFLEHNDDILKGKTVYGHQGLGSGAILNVYFEPESEFVFVLMSNGGSMVRQNRVGVLAHNLINYLYPLFGQ